MSSHANEPLKVIAGRARTAFWLPRSSVGASGDAPASRRATGRWSGRTTLPRWSVGAWERGAEMR
jgi:hypothetical protein